MATRFATKGARCLGVLAFAILIALAACQASAKWHTVHGVITDLQARDIAHADWIRLRTDQGAELQLKVADSVLFSASHLRQHMIFAEPVTVTYEDRADGPVATAIDD